MKKCKMKKKILWMVMGGFVPMVMYIHSSWLFSLLLFLLSKMPCIVMGLYYQCPFFFSEEANPSNNKTFIKV